MRRYKLLYFCDLKYTSRCSFIQKKTKKHCIPGLSNALFYRVLGLQITVETRRELAPIIALYLDISLLLIICHAHQWDLGSVRHTFICLSRLIDCKCETAKIIHVGCDHISVYNRHVEGCNSRLLFTPPCTTGKEILPRAYRWASLSVSEWWEEDCFWEIKCLINRNETNFNCEASFKCPDS